jgi:N-acetyl-alpha-D-glucosaminyl L-malate synthase BshA
MFPKYKGDYYGSFVFDEAKMLVKKGFEVHVVTQHNPHIPYEEIMDGIHVHRFKWLEPKEFKALVHFNGLIDNFRLITYIISLFFNLMWIIKKYNVNVVHSHSVIPTGFIGVIVAKIMGKPVFITAHGMDVNNFEEKTFFKLLIQFSLNNCNKAIAVSKNLALKMISFGVDEDNILILRNAIDTDRFKPINNQKIRKIYNINNNDILILFVGYLDTFKGIFELINAFDKIQQDNKNVKLMIVGTGPKKHELKDKITKMNLKNSIIFTGKLRPDEMHDYYQAADIFTLPSYTEGLPLVVLEAMACGLPVVVSNVGGIPEVINEGENGFLISPKNEEILTKKLIILVKNTQLRNQFAKKSVKIIENEFDINKKINRLINLYNGS